MIYWFLSVATAAVAYFFGSLSSVTIASTFVFKSNLRKLGGGNSWLSNFRRVYGIKGAVELLLVELLRDIIPVLLGGLLFGIKDQALAGRALAGFCLIMGRLYPAFNRLRGSHATICLIVVATLIDIPAGIIVLVFVAAGIGVSKYLSFGTLAGAVGFAVASVLVVDDSLVLKLCLFIVAVICIKHIPAISRMINGRELKLSLQEDITYKLDSKF